MIAHPHESDISTLKQIWKSCFDDNKAIIDLFFATVYRPENTYVWCENNKIVSALYMIEYSKGKGVYLYALGTLPEYRNHSYMKKMLDKVLHSDYESAFLIPASKSLEQYYAGFGFTHSHIPLFSLKHYEKCHEIPIIEINTMLNMISQNWAYTNDDLDFCDNVKFYVLSEEADEANITFHRILIDNQTEGYVIISEKNSHPILLHYGMSEKAYQYLEPVILDKTDIMIYNKTADIIHIKGGFVPY